MYILTFLVHFSNRNARKEVFLLWIGYLHMGLFCLLVIVPFRSKLKDLFLHRELTFFFSSFVYLLLFPQCLVWFSWMQLCAEIVKRPKLKTFYYPLLSKPHCALYVWWYKINIRIVSSMFLLSALLN